MMATEPVDLDRIEASLSEIREMFVKVGSRTVTADATRRLTRMADAVNEIPALVAECRRLREALELITRVSAGDGRMVARAALGHAEQKAADA